MSIANQGEEQLKGANFQVCVRVRPLNIKEEQQVQKKFHSIVQIQDKMVFLYDPNETSIKDIVNYQQGGNNIPSNNPSTLGTGGTGVQKRPEKEFIFDEVFDESTSTEEVFCKSVLPSVDHIMNGYNSTIFAYGMTGAGKSFTIFGNLYSSNNNSDGIALMTLKALSEKAQESTNQVSFRFSYLEIYNENIRDLMVPKTENLMVIEDPEKGVFVPDLTEYPLESPEDVKNFIIQGNTRRVMASTAANQFSSRSHAIIQIMCEQKNHGQNLSLVSKLCIVDLAGSERAASTENRGMRLTEGANINRSLLALGNCINLLSDASKKGSFVPYRDSKLTRLLKESLGGNTKSIMIACISPSSLCYEETINTMKYAARARKIKKCVKKNAQEMSQHVTEYKSIITGLRSEIISLKEQLQIKNEENLQLKNKQRFIHQYNSGSSVDTPTEDTKGPSSVDEIGQKLFENLEENWEIKNTIEEIINLNRISDKFIQEQEERLQGNQLKGEERRECKFEIEKRREVIQSNQEILAEIDEKLAKNIEQKMELQAKIQNFGQQFTGSVFQDGPEEFKDLDALKNIQIQEMLKKMELMQEQLKHKDKLLQQKQQIIKDLTGKETSSQQQILQKKNNSQNNINTSSQVSIVLQSSQQQLPLNQVNARKFYLKIPKEMISERAAISNQSICSSSSVSLGNQLQFNQGSSSSNVCGGKQSLKRQSSINTNCSQIEEHSYNLIKKVREGSTKRSQQPPNQTPQPQQIHQAQHTALRRPSTSKNSHLSSRQAFQQQSQQQGRERERQQSSNSKNNMGQTSKNSSTQKKNGTKVANKQQGSINGSNSGKKMEISISELKQYAQKLKNVDFSNIGRQQNSLFSQQESNEANYPLNNASKVPLDDLENYRIVEPIPQPELELKQNSATLNVEMILSQLNKKVEERVAQQQISDCLKQIESAISGSVLSKYPKTISPQQEQLDISQGEIEDQQENSEQILDTEQDNFEKQQRYNYASNCREQRKNQDHYHQDEDQIEQEEQEQQFEELRSRTRWDTNNLGEKNKGTRSVSCYKMGGQDYELNSYALARKKVREFKDKLAKVSENTQKYTREEIANVIKEYKVNNYQIKNQEDENRLRMLESLLEQKPIKKIQDIKQNNENTQPLSQYKQIIASKSNMTTSSGPHPQKKTAYSQHNGSSNNQSYAQQQQMRMLKSRELNSNNSNPNALKNISNNLNQLPPTNSPAASATASCKNKKVLPRGLLSQLNSNYAESVTYSKKVTNSSINSSTTNQSSFHHSQQTQGSSNRDRSPNSTKNRDNSTQRNQEQCFGQSVQHGINSYQKGSCKQQVQPFCQPFKEQLHPQSSILYQYNSESHLNNS